MLKQYYKLIIILFASIVYFGEALRAENLNSSIPEFSKLNIYTSFIPKGAKLFTFDISPEKISSLKALKFDPNNLPNVLDNNGEYSFQDTALTNKRSLSIKYDTANFSLAKIAVLPGSAEKFILFVDKNQKSIFAAIYNPNSSNAACANCLFLAENFFFGTSSSELVFAFANILADTILELSYKELEGEEKIKSLSFAAETLANWQDLVGAPGFDESLNVASNKIINSIKAYLDLVSNSADKESDLTSLHETLKNKFYPEFYAALNFSAMGSGNPGPAYDLAKARENLPDFYKSPYGNEEEDNTGTNQSSTSSSSTNNSTSNNDSAMDKLRAAKRPLILAKAILDERANVTPACKTKGYTYHPSQRGLGSVGCDGSLTTSFVTPFLTFYFNSQLDEEVFGVKGLYTSFHEYITADLKYLIIGNKKVELSKDLKPLIDFWDSYPEIKKDKAGISLTDYFSQTTKVYKQLWSSYDYTLKQILDLKTGKILVDIAYDKALNPIKITSYKDGTEINKVNISGDKKSGLTISSTAYPDTVSRVSFTSDFISEIDNSYGDDYNSKLVIRSQAGESHALPLEVKTYSNSNFISSKYYGFTKKGEILYFSDGLNETEVSYPQGGSSFLIFKDNTKRENSIAYKNFGSYTLPAYYSTPLGNVALRYDNQNNYRENKVWSLEFNAWIEKLVYRRGLRSLVYKNKHPIQGEESYELILDKEGKRTINKKQTLPDGTVLYSSEFKEGANGSSYTKTSGEYTSRIEVQASDERYTKDEQLTLAGKLVKHVSEESTSSVSTIINHLTGETYSTRKFGDDSNYKIEESLSGPNTLEQKRVYGFNGTDTSQNSFMANYEAGSLRTFSTQSQNESSYSTTSFNPIPGSNSWQRENSTSDSSGYSRSIGFAGEPKVPGFKE